LGGNKSRERLPGHILFVFLPVDRDLIDRFVASRSIQTPELKLLDLPFLAKGTCALGA
jgi:hypothetical protein